LWDDLAGYAEGLEGLTDTLSDFGLPSAGGASLGIGVAKALAKSTGFDPFGIFGESSSAASSAPTGPQATGAAEIFGGGMTAGGGASSMYDYGNGFALTTSPRRGLIPYGGGVIPSGYRVVQRAARRPTAGYPGGTYLARRRSMNPLNPRALMRAERRMGAFTNWVKRHFRIAMHAPKRRKTVGKRRRK
jgi:hypothetical protein